MPAQRLVLTRYIMTFYQRPCHFWESIAWVRSCITFVKSFATKWILCTKWISQLILPIILCNEKKFSSISDFVIKGWVYLHKLIMIQLLSRPIDSQIWIRMVLEKSTDSAPKIFIGELLAHWKHATVGLHGCWISPNFCPPSGSIHPTEHSRSILLEGALVHLNT